MTTEPSHTSETSDVTYNQLQTFTEAEAAALLKVSRITLQRLRLAGEISYSRVGNQVRYVARNLTDFLSSRERVSIHTVKPAEGLAHQPNSQPLPQC